MSIKKSHKTYRIAGLVMKHTGLIAGGLIMMLPFVWMALTSFKNSKEVLKVPIQWFPEHMQWDNYAQVLNTLEFGRYYMNTAIVTTGLVVGQLALCSMAAYAFSRLRFPCRRIIFGIILSVMMIPSQMTLIPNYTTLVALGWNNTFQGIILPLVPTAYGVFFLSQVFKGIPSEIEQAAKIDGCSPFGTYIRVGLPLAVNGLVSFGILVMLYAWNEFMWPLIVVGNDKMRTLSLAVAALKSYRDIQTKYHILMAASVMTIIPVLLVFLIGQRRFIAGIMSGSVKG
ncbi:MAG: carbohydrate ABC transporter permease [Oscillospiraceae bacterium]|nr:carbohydrate ABC transporter permease [Oscillospiraceae bacterium]